MQEKTKTEVLKHIAERARSIKEHARRYLSPSDMDKIEADSRMAVGSSVLHTQSPAPGHPGL